MTIYIDIVLIENFIMNYIILFATGITLKIKIKKIRLSMASIIGAIYSVISYVSNIEIYSTLILKILLSIIIVYIAFYPQNIKQLGKYILLFYLVSFVFGGVAFALIYVIKPQEIIMRNGLFLGTYPLKSIILGAIVAFVIIVLSFKIIKNKFSKKDLLCDIEVKLNGKTIKTKAMLDTGNMLKEPITNIPVVVIEHVELYDVISKEILNNVENILGGDFKNISKEIKQEYMSKLKLIPYSSLGKQNGMLLGIKAENIKIQYDEKEFEKQKIIIGIYNKSLTKKGEYKALIGMDLVEST